jgi:hypothetical protein
MNIQRERGHLSMSIISFASCLWTSDELVDEVRIPNYPWNSDIGKDLKKKKKLTL